MRGVSIWFVAQIIYAAIIVTAFGREAIFVSVFSVMGGMPALLVFILTDRAVNGTSRSALVASAAIATTVMIAATAACSFGLMKMLDPNSSELLPFAIWALPATTLSACLHYGRLIINHKKRNL